MVDKLSKIISCEHRQREITEEIGEISWKQDTETEQIEVAKYTSEAKSVQSGTKLEFVNNFTVEFTLHFIYIFPRQISLFVMRDNNW